MTDTGSVQQASNGDRDAFDALMTSVVGRLYRISYLVLRDADAAQDAVQEALVRCWRDLPSLRDPERFDAWLNRPLLNAVNDEARRRRRRITVSVTAAQVEPIGPDRAQDIADRDEIDRAFRRLSVDHRTIVVLYHYLGMSLGESAAYLGVPVGTAKSRLHYATEALRAALAADARSVSSREALA